MLTLDPTILESFILDKGLSFKKNSVSFIFQCPKCCKKDKLYIRRRDGRFICFVCATTENFCGRAEYALSELCNLPLWQIREEIYGENLDVSEDGLLDLDFGIRLDDDSILESDIPIPTIAWPHNYYLLEDWRAKRGREYLVSRGISDYLDNQYGLRYCPEERRVAFPIEVEGRLVGWQKRIVIPNRHWDEELGKWNEVPKILSSVNIPRDRTLMFGDRLKGSNHAILCEGPIDAIKMHLAGGNVATMGKVVSKGQIDLILKSGVKKVYLALDPDAAMETQKLLGVLADLECYLLQPPNGKKDIGELSLEEAYEAFLNAPLLNPGHLFIFFNTK